MQWFHLLGIFIATLISTVSCISDWLFSWDGLCVIWAAGMQSVSLSVSGVTPREQQTDSHLCCSLSACTGRETKRLPWMRSTLGKNTLNRPKHASPRFCTCSQPHILGFGRVLATDGTFIHTNTQLKCLTTEGAFMLPINIFRPTGDVNKGLLKFDFNSPTPLVMFVQ